MKKTKREKKVMKASKDEDNKLLSNRKDKERMQNVTKREKKI